MNIYEIFKHWGILEIQKEYSSAQTNALLIDADANAEYLILNYVISKDTQGTALILSSSGTSISTKHYIAANGGVATSDWIRAGVNKPLRYTSTGGGNESLHIVYTKIPKKA